MAWSDLTAKTTLGIQPDPTAAERKEYLDYIVRQGGWQLPVIPNVGWEPYNESIDDAMPRYRFGLFMIYIDHQDDEGSEYSPEHRAIHGRYTVTVAKWCPKFGIGGDDGEELTVLNSNDWNEVLSFVYGHPTIFDFDTRPWAGRSARELG